jgi:transcriptional regulator PpsR
MTRAAKAVAAADASPIPRELDADQARRLIEVAGDVALVLDGNGLVLDVFSHDLELQKAIRRDWRGRAWADTVTIESRDKVEAVLDAALADAAAAPRQVNHPAKEGPDLPLLYAAVRVSGHARARAAARIVAVGRDLRDTVALQRRLVDAQQSMERDYWRFREAETRYRNLFQSSAEAVLIVDGATLRVVEANPAAVTLLGGGAAKAAKSVGVALASLFAAETAEPLAAALAAARSVGKHERLLATLVGSKRSVSIAISSFRQDHASFLLVRLAPQAEEQALRARRDGARSSSARNGDDADDLASAFVRASGDALAFTDTAGRVIAVNRAFARMAQLSSEDQARGESLDRWLGRTGIELSMLLANLRELGPASAAGLFATELRGALGLVTEVEVAASTLEPAGTAAFAFSVRDVGRRLAPSERALPTKVPASVQQLTELVGRVPLKQIVAETSDLIERLSIETALAMTKDNRAMAAQLLGLSRQSLYVKLRRFGMGGLEAGDEV